jgi:hypothetical protein
MEVKMAYPENPETIILRNEFYRNGLKEIDIWNYYQSVKRELLNETKSRDVMLGIMVDVNKPVLRRKGKGQDWIRLTPQNYDEVITGRTLTVYSSMGMYEDFGIIDIDVSDYDGFSWARIVASNVYDFVMDKMPVVRSAQIRYTGKTSFHIVCKFNRKMKIDSIRFLLQRFLQSSDLAKVYTVSGKRKAGVPNLDLSPNKYRGNYITLHSLSLIGLKCMDVSYVEVTSFNKNKARI